MATAASATTRPTEAGRGGGFGGGGGGRSGDPFDLEAMLGGVQKGLGEFKDSVDDFLSREDVAQFKDKAGETSRHVLTNVGDGLRNLFESGKEAWEDKVNPALRQLGDGIKESFAAHDDDPRDPRRRLPHDHHYPGPYGVPPHVGPGSAYPGSLHGVAPPRPHDPRRGANADEEALQVAIALSLSEEQRHRQQQQQQQQRQQPAGAAATTARAATAAAAA